MKSLGIGKIFFHITTSSEEIENDSVAKRLDAAMTDVANVLEKHGLSNAPGYTAFFSFHKYSIANCQNCHHLMINRTQNPIGLASSDFEQDLPWIIRNGGEHEGKLLCDECLPSSHRWSCGA